ncbi:MAG: NAD(P)/FAD-dependent oxidoreductase [Pararhodobacter sp.]
MVEFLIIGGGIAGLSAGARLVRLGPVLLLEGEDALGHHASGRSAALYETDYGAPATVALARASEAELVALGVLSPRGVMVVAQAHEAVAYARDCGDLRLAPLTLSEARTMVPILHPERVAFAGYTAQAQNIDTDRLLQSYARQLREAGGQIRTRARLVALARRDGLWHATLADGAVVTARRLVNAAGAWADAVAVMAGLPALGIRPYRRSIAQIPAPGGHDVSAWPMVFGAGETWYAKPEAGKLLVSPAEEDPTEPHDAWADDMVLAEGLARYEEMVTEPVTRVETSWAGLRSFSPDRAPVLGADPLEPSFLWCAGQGGQGFLSAPGAAQVMAAAAGGALSSFAPAILAALSPARFR